MAQNKIVKNFLDNDKVSFRREEVESLLESLGLITEEERSICHCYSTRKEIHYYTEFEKGMYYAKFGKYLENDYEEQEVPYCLGTMERDICHCKGNVKKCDFYPEKRGENRYGKN